METVKMCTTWRRCRNSRLWRYYMFWCWKLCSA